MNNEQKILDKLNKRYSNKNYLTIEYSPFRFQIISFEIKGQNNPFVIVSWTDSTNSIMGNPSYKTCDEFKHEVETYFGLSVVWRKR